MEFEIISSYTWDQGVTDGTLVKLFENRWQDLAGGQPIVMTATVATDFSLAALREIWNEYVVWRTTIMETLPEEDQLFATTMNGKTVWVMDDGTVFTVLYPEDY